MINKLGKSLVVFNLILSGMFLAIAIAVYSHPIDWGWKLPREWLGESIPSEIDKRTAALKQARSTAAIAEAKIDQVGVQHIGARFFWHENYVWAASRLKDMYGGKSKLDLKHLQYDKGKLALTYAKLGTPKTAGPVVYKYNDGKKVVAIDVNKSRPVYLAELKQLEGQLQELNGNIVTEVAKQKIVTLELLGQIDPKTKKNKTPGLYVLLQNEIERQKLVKKEIKDIKPLWVRKLVDAELLIERRKRLEARLEELKEQLAVLGK